MNPEYSESPGDAAGAARRGGIGAYPHLWLGFMLLALHAALAWDIGQWWARAFLLAHFGLFLLWQPVWRGEREIEPRYAVLVVIVGVLLAAWNSWWLMAVWLAVLFGLIGGSVPGVTDRRQRLALMLVAFYLLSVLLVWVVPQLFTDRTLDTAQVMLVRYGLPVIPLAILLLRFEPRRSPAPLAVDLFSSMLLFLLVAALVLGSFVVKEVSHGNYPVALAQSLIVMALLLLALSWLWNPHGGFAGLGHMLSRYLMSLGLPFERWIQALAALAEREAQPERFLALALEHTLELPWVAGVQWSEPHSDGERGVRTEHSAEFTFRDLQLRIYTRWPLSPAVLLHLKLLAQMVGHFHEAKRREQIQRQNAYAQAIHETGARLTHDVKNLLQSLRSLCSAVETSGAEQAGALQALMQRQLPQITQRLNVTLDKLKAPREAEASRTGAAPWWDGLTQRYSGRGIVFSCEGSSVGATVPGELFDSVADNLIENALAKRTGDSSVEVRVTFSPERGCALAVCDSGAAVPRGVAVRLFGAPVPSQTGLGIGLYHAAKEADRLGYRLALASNEPGRVCFRLAPDGA